MSNATCSYTGCDKNSRTRGFCSAHYERLRKYGDPSVVMPPSPPPTLRKHWTCQVQDCKEPHLARGMCNAHYRRWRKYGDPTARFERPTECAVDGCTEPPRGHGWCRRHYLRWYVHGDAEYERTTYTECTVNGCTAAPRSPLSQWCEKHYGRLRRNGDPEALAERQAFTGYRAAHSRLTKSKGRAADHRCVDCGQGADHWSYNHLDPEPLYSEIGLPYSMDADCYEPRCRRCHKAFDAAHTV